MASAVLPLKLGDFTASKKTNGIQLNWETLMEQNVSHFEVERSPDGISFSKIGQVTAKGNSTDKTAYGYLDMQGNGATIFYRLRMVDIDGTAIYSRVIAIKNEGSLLSLQVFPNPVSDVLQVQLLLDKKEIVNMSITDASGKTVHRTSLSLNKGQNATSIPVAHLPAGTYYIILTGEATHQSTKFIKQ